MLSGGVSCGKETNFSTVAPTPLGFETPWGQSETARLVVSASLYGDTGCVVASSAVSAVSAAEWVYNRDTDHHLSFFSQNRTRTPHFSRKKLPIRPFLTA